MRQASYRMIVMGMFFPVILLIAYAISAGHPGPAVAVFGVVFVLPFSLIFLVMGALRLISAIEHEAKGKKGPVKH